MYIHVSGLRVELMYIDLWEMVYMYVYVLLIAVTKRQP